jgi:cold shock CspA family protein
VVKKGLNALYYSSGEVDSQYGFIPVSVEEGEDVYVHQDEFQIRKIDFESCLEDTSISFC